MFFKKDVKLIVLLLIFFLVFFLPVVIRWAMLRRRRRREQNLNLLRMLLEIIENEMDEQVVGEALDPAILAKLPKCEFKAGTMSAADCVVCLCKIMDEEIVRCLPNCKHIFHLECVDMWLYSHSTCPICRSSAAPGEIAITVQEDEAPAPNTTKGTRSPPENTSTTVDR